MKTSLVLITALALFSNFASLTASAGDAQPSCKLSGVPKVPGMIIVPWARIKETAPAANLEECVKAAQQMLEYRKNGETSECTPSGRCEDVKFVMTVKKVNYSFKDGGAYEYEGEVKKTKN